MVWKATVMSGNPNIIVHDFSPVGSSIAMFRIKVRILHPKRPPVMKSC